MPCCAPAILQQYRVVRENPHVAGKIRTASYEIPHGGQKKLNLGRLPTGRWEMADVNSHVPCHGPGVALKSRKAVWSEHGIGQAWYV